MELGRRLRGLVRHLGSHARDLLRLRVDEVRRQVDHAHERARLQPAVERQLAGPLLQRLAVLTVELRVGKWQRPAGGGERNDRERKQTPHGKSPRRKSQRSPTPPLPPPPPPPP